MGELSLPILIYVIIFLALPFIFGYVARHFKLPLILGYMASGIALSLFFRQESQAMLSLFANIGLLLLLFTVGLEIHLDTFRKLSRFVIIGGLLQVGFTALVLLVLSVVFGFGALQSIILSIAFSFSSTAVVSKIMTERDEEQTLFGQLAMGVLLFQDLLVIPLIVILSSLETGQTGFALIATVAVSLIKSALILGLVYLLGEKIVPRVFEKGGRFSSELLNVFAVLFIFLTVFLFSLLGLSGTLAAFIAGLLVGQTLEHQQIFSQIRPMRDIFVILFFVFLGATLDVSTHINLLPIIIIFGLLLVVIKVVVTTLIFMYLRFHSKVSFAIGIMLSQVGEFAFIILHQAKLIHFIDERLYFVSVGVTMFSIILTPIAINNRVKLYKDITDFLSKYLPVVNHFISYGVDRDLGHTAPSDLKDNVVICGYGSMGKYIGRALKLADVKYVAIDYDYYLVKSARSEDAPIIYGDPTQIDLLEYAHVGSASCLVSVVPDMISQEAILLNARSLNSKLVIFSRVNRDVDQKRMKDLGAEVVVQPEFEGAVSIIKKILAGQSISKDDIVGKIKRLRLEHGMA